MTYILGIDTSAYTTSIALLDGENNKILADERKVLEVKKGQKGLRQQDAVFQHLKNFPELFQRINHDLSKVKIVSVSSRPRNVEGSYMPVFTVGQNFGRVIAKSLNCKYVEYSHQENHIAASLIEDYKRVDKVIGVHLSGGTTEFIFARKSIKGFETEILGGTKDITFGQLIDRIGTLMDFPFPCGMHMEKYIEGKTFERMKTPPIRGDSFINLSGMENYYSSLYLNNKYTKESIIYSLFEYIGECIVHIINNLSSIQLNTVVISGGIASNKSIRNYIKSNIYDYEIIFPSVENSTDNGIGVALLPIIDRWYNEIKAD